MAGAIGQQGKFGVGRYGKGSGKFRPYGQGGTSTMARQKFGR